MVHSVKPSVQFFLMFVSMDEEPLSLFALDKLHFWHSLSFSNYLVPNRRNVLFVDM